VAGKSDAELIAASRRDPEAFGAIFDRHYDAIFRFAERRIGRDAALELASEVFLTAFRVRENYGPERTSARPWLMGIASRLVLHEQRRFARYANAVQRAASHTHSSSTETQVLGTLELAALYEALDKIDPESRELLLLVTWEGLSYSDAAEALGVPVGTVRSRVHRVRRDLAARLHLHEPELL
jgi:RNA polymerase sigma-70 factor (ECF subfamily)